jgi:hypothetical protein
MQRWLSGHERAVTLKMKTRDYSRLPAWELPSATVNCETVIRAWAQKQIPYNDGTRYRKPYLRFITNSLGSVISSMA